MNSIEKIPITDYQSLLQEKMRLKKQIGFTETHLKNKWRDLRNHYPDMILKPSMPFSENTNQKVISAMQWLNELLFSGIFNADKKSFANETARFVIRLAQVMAVKKVAGIFKKES